MGLTSKRRAPRRARPAVDSGALDRYVDLNQADQGVVAWRTLQEIERLARQDPRAPLSAALRILRAKMDEHAGLKI